MKKIVPFSKEINFQNKIGEITSISLDNTLKLDNQFVSGEFIITGLYKMISTSDIEESFEYKIPVDIAIDNKYETKNCTISIDDFTYEIINEEILKINISVSLDDLDIKEDEIETIEIEAPREDIFNLDIDLPNMEKEIENSLKDNLENKTIKTKEIEQENQELKQKNNNIKLTNESKKDIELDLFNNLNDDKEYSIYRVYTVKEDDTIELILDKFNISRELLSDYNDLDNLVVGSKIIIPSIDE